MTDPIRQACRYDLAFPFHGPESATGRLDAIARYIDEAGLGRDFYAAGTGGERLERRVADLFGFEAALCLRQLRSIRPDTTYLSTASP